MYYDSGFLIGLKAFVAAIIGGLVSYPLTAIGALAVGAVESFASFWSGALKDVIVFSLLIPVLMLRSFFMAPCRGRSRGSRPMKPQHRQFAMLGVVVAGLAIAPALLGNFAVSLLNDIGIGALVALGLVLLTGVGGATSFGQAAFVGIAAYATAWLTTVHGASPWLGLAFALALTGVAALAIGLLTLRLGGHFLPLSTIAWGLSIALLFGNMDALGRHTGMSNIPPLRIGAWSLVDARSIYYLVWILVGLACLFSYNVLQSRTGRAIRALRGGAVLLGSVGADAFRVRLDAVRHGGPARRRWRAGSMRT